MGKGRTISYLASAIFLMALSAIGPGFLTQTTVFTEKFASNFAFAILASIIIDIGVQLNVWRIITVAKKRGHEIASAVFPGLGVFVTFLIVLGGIAFNIGNIAGTGLALNVLFGMDTLTGAILSAFFAIWIFSMKEANEAMDRVVKVLGVVMILLTTFVAIKSSPPVGEALVKSVFPDDYGVLMLPMITLIGGTVGGYITFAGAHRLLDAGISGKENLKQVSNAATTGIIVTGIMRTILFLAALGVVAAGHSLNPANPPASVFQIALGDIGYKFFGIVLWAAAITSVIGAAYTSVSFLRGYHEFFDKYNNYVIIGFIALSTMIFAILGRPVTMLVVAGSLNGLILPMTLGAMLLAAYNKKIMGDDYSHPKHLFAFGLLAMAITIYAGYLSLGPMLKLLQ